MSIISVLAATRMLKKGCEAYLAHIVSIEGDASNISNISVVSRFSDVFSEDLQGLPPFRKMEFGIDLVANARPTSRVPYWMAPIELKELKTQL